MSAEAPASSVPGSDTAPSKSLNANAKSFIPKLDGPSLQDEQRRATATTPQHNDPASTVSNRGSGAPRLGTTPSFRGAANPPPVTFPVSPFAAGIPSPMLMMPNMLPTPQRGVPSSPFLAPPPSPTVSVGNAALAALHSKEPPKLCCVLLVGNPGCGKTTCGRELVQGLIQDSMHWSFFSGSDYIKDTVNRRAAWETTKDVFDALSKKLDALLAQQKVAFEALQQGKKSFDTPPLLKGLVIDKNCRGVEDLHYLAALLRTKGVLLVGVIGIEANEDVLLKRIKGSDEVVEKLKHHRVIQHRIAETAKGVGIYRAVDGNKSIDDVVRNLRTMVLGCSAQPTTRTISVTTYADSCVPMVDNYEEYCNVMTGLFQLIPPGNKGYQFPGFTEYQPLSTKDMDDKLKVQRLGDGNYCVRRKVDGTKCILIYDGKGLYLVLRHMRAVLSMPLESWFGVPLDRVGRVVLDGELVRAKEPHRGKEKFVAYDALYWSEKGQMNLLGHAMWKERQNQLDSNLCDEATAFFPKKVDCIVVHQRSSPIKDSIDLLEPCDGLIFQPLRRGDPIYAWRPESAMTVDVRLGALLSTVSMPSASPPEGRSQAPPSAPQPQQVKTFAVEAYSKTDGRYVRLGGDEVEVRRGDVIEGSICTCGISVDAATGQRTWRFDRVRYDLSRSMYKSSIDDIVQNCMISRAKFVQWLLTERLVEDRHASGLLGTATQPDAPLIPASAPPPSTVPSTSATRGAFGSALGSNSNTNTSTTTLHAPPPPTTVAQHLLNAQRKNAAMAAAAAAASDDSQFALLMRVVPSANVKTVKQPESQMEMLGAVVQNVKFVREAPAPPPMREEPPLRKERTEWTCASCHKSKKKEDLRQDPADKKFYCYACWAVEGSEFCAECGEFAKGHRESSRRRTSAFYCEPCWEKYREENKNTEQKKPDEDNGQDADETDEKKKKRARARKKKSEGTTGATEGEQEEAAATGGNEAEVAVAEEAPSTA